MFRKFALTTLGAAMLLTASVPALAMPRGNGLPVVKTESVQLIGHRYIRRNRQYRRNYRRRHRRQNNGAAAVAAIIGLGTVLAITSSRRNAYYNDRHYGHAPVYGYQPGSVEWIAACARKYRSFEPYSGLYTTYAGYKRRCRLP